MRLLKSEELLRTDSNRNELSEKNKRFSFVLKAVLLFLNLSFF